MARLRPFGLDVLRGATSAMPASAPSTSAPVPAPDLGARRGLVTPSPDHEVESGVSLLRWPEEEALRSGLAVLGRPRILLIDDGVAPPATPDQLEDWLRWPPDPEELAARARTLGQRAQPTADRPTLDEDGLLRRGTAWVAISDIQLPLLRHLLDNFDRVVRYETVAELYATAGGTTHIASVRTVLSRVDARVRPLGLELASVRRRGVILRTLQS